MNWIIFILVIQALHFAGTWKLYKKAGRKSWEAAIPVYNAVVLMGIINRPKWWVLLLFIPIINLLIFPVIWVEIARSFRKFETKDTWLAILSLGFYSFYLNYVVFDQLKYNENRSTKAPSKTGEWVSSITFAIAAATFVHTYFMQPFTIPTSSLEKSLLIGDFLFVSKFHYGAKTPISPLALPMVHDSVPKTPLPSYIKGIELPYFRLPGIQKVKRNEIVVFNWPSDSLKTMWGDNSGEFTYKPIDKRTNYVKRCVGIPGDSLEVRNGYIYINGEKTVLPDRAKPQFNYTITPKSFVEYDYFTKLYNVNPDEWNYRFTANYSLNKNQLGRLASLISESHNYNIDGAPIRNPYSINIDYDLGVDSNGANTLQLSFSRNAFGSMNINSIFKQLKNDLNIDNDNVKFISFSYTVNLDGEHATKIKSDNKFKSIERIIAPKGKYDSSIFPHDPQYAWSQDNYGPLYIPAQGEQVELNEASLPFYKRIISEYEKNDFEIKNGKYYINGKESSTYTFKQDYFWMMGDNRQRSLDARYWGYTPFDHVVGKPVFIWLSIDQNETAINKKIRWERMFTTVHGSGEPRSYLLYFIIAIAIYYVGKSWLEKRKLEK